MKKYFFHNGQEQQGPFTIDELRIIDISRQTPIWYEGLNAWISAEQVDELRPLFSIPPVIDLDLETPTFKSGKIFGKNILVLGIIAVLVFAGLFFYQKYQESKASVLAMQTISREQEKVNLEQEQKKREALIINSVRENITNYITVQRSEYLSNALGGISNLRITVANASDYKIDKVQVKIYYIKSSGGVWDTKTVDFNLLPPHSKSTLPIEDTERGVRVTYEIISIHSNTLGL